MTTDQAGKTKVYDCSDFKRTFHSAGYPSVQFILCAAFCCTSDDKQDTMQRAPQYWAPYTSYAMSVIQQTHVQ